MLLPEIYLAFMDAIQNDPMDSISEIITVIDNDNKFRVDLSQSDVRAGDTVSILALKDKDYANGFPFPSKDDYLGFYIDRDSFSFL